MISLLSACCAHVNNADVDVLHKLLVENYKDLSRWEVYKNEVESGHLQWGSTHTEAFFKENARMMEGSDGDFRLVKVLIALLSSQDEDVAAIACYDIGEFVRHYPNGRAIAKRLGAKELVMPLIEHENVELQRHALQCVSKIMVQNWEVSSCCGCLSVYLVPWAQVFVLPLCSS